MIFRTEPPYLDGIGVRSYNPIMMAFLLLIFLSVPKVFIADYQGIISPIAAEYMTRVISEAEGSHAELVIFTLDTPGGLDQSMRMIVKKIMNSSVPVCVYVYPPGARAASAGVFITLAAHIAAMAPGTNIGAAHPVSFGQKMDSTMVEKVTNDAVAYIKSIAKERGRNEKWAEDAVRKSVSIPADEAVKKKVVDLIATSIDDLLKKIDGKKVEVNGRTVELHTANAQLIKIHMGFREKLLAILANPNVSYILMILGFYGLFFELSHPGSILPGVIGAISLILAFYSFQALPVNYAGVFLILLAMIFFIAEVKVQSHGLLAIGGVISLILGSLMLYNTNASFMRVNYSTIAVVVALTLAFFLFVIAKSVEALRRKPVTGFNGLVGLKGIAKTKITPEKPGTVLVHGELWTAKSDEVIEKGEEIKVVDTEGFTLIVKKLEEEEK